MATSARCTSGALTTPLAVCTVTRTIQVRPSPSSGISLRGALAHAAAAGAARRSTAAAAGSRRRSIGSDGRGGRAPRALLQAEADLPHEIEAAEGLGHVVVGAHREALL